MVVEAGTQEERIVGRVWTVRLDPYGRPSAGTVRLSCSRPACADQHLPSTAAGRKAAIEHISMHLAHIREGGGPRPGAWCGCRAADCAWHTPDAGPLPGRRAGARPLTGSVRCGGPVVLAAYADRAGRLWRIAEICARCAAATAGCRVLDTAASPPRRAPDEPGTSHEADQRPVGGTAASGMAAVFSDGGSSPASPLTGASSPAYPASQAAGPAPVQRTRAASPDGTPRRAKRRAKIAQRTVPLDLQPDALREELIELGDAFRDYQRSTEPDLALLAELHERKARAFALWADVTGDASLHQEAKRAETAAQTTRDMHANRAGLLDGDGPAVDRLLTRSHAVHARTVLDYVQAHAPYHEAEVHLAVLLFTLRAARAGTGNVTGQDLTSWLSGNAEQVLERLITAEWLHLPGTVAEALASRPEDPTAITVPTLLPEQGRPFDFGKTTRSKISGWAQKAVGDRKLRKKKLGAATRLLAVYTAAHTQPDGRLGSAEDDGLHLEKVAAFCALDPEDIAEHAGLLIAADWLSEADTTQGKLRGQLTERVLPLGGLL
ncbi:hypothetical protein ABZ951_32780 [Streptomyces sp. NPDC046215]|uniref:Uncharacterized protein n=1 Tax=Streptomyces stramineus TaxID=173861 RepID=A0ABP3KWF3_9ACTN